MGCVAFTLPTLSCSPFFFSQIIPSARKHSVFKCSHYGGGGWVLRTPPGGSGRVGYPPRGFSSYFGTGVPKFFNPKGGFPDPPPPGIGVCRPGKKKSLCQKEFPLAKRYGGSPTGLSGSRIMEYVFSSDRCELQKCSSLKIFDGE